ncbi:MAG: hypothetical protein QF682_07075 [Candidatus Thermoplasmatota archaeon]|jgi:hypothetical protein|nr:hypothetical protein [Candidatus Thermoplasmatota archaeon]
MKKVIFTIMIVLAIGLSTITMGCLDEVSITGHAKSYKEETTGVYTYNYVVAVVIGDAKVDKVKLKLEDKDDDDIIDKEKDGWIGTGDELGSSIIFIDIAGETDMVNSGDIFSLITLTNCSGGTLNIYYDGDKVDKVKDLD